jgi:hypothetical protein
MFLVDVTHSVWIVLVPRRGCWITAIDKEGNITRDREHDSQRRLFINCGDRLMVWGNAANDEVALVEVVWIDQSRTAEKLGTKVIAGVITEATATAMVVAAGRAA